MTIEEYDKKTPIRNTLREIDDILNTYSNIDNDIAGGSLYQLTVGAIIYKGVLMPPYEKRYITTDAKIIEGFKQLLLDRKQELLDKFLKD